MADYLGSLHPELAHRLPKTSLANLPTPVKLTRFRVAGERKTIAIKYDNLSSELYGGNKVRKLEYILHRAAERHAKRIATFGTVASNHALATALFSAKLNFACTCFLSHQTKTDTAPLALNMHLRNGTEIVRYGGGRTSRIETLRKHLRHRNVWMIPMGGSSWLGTIGFVNAGLELAAQVAAGEIATPDYLYVADGTMATAAGLALGLALAELPTQVQAIRVTHATVSSPLAMQRLLRKTAALMHRFDGSIPTDLADRTKISVRDEFFAGGYARSDATTDRAIAIAQHDLGLTLDTTYTGKAMAAMLHDLRQTKHTRPKILFWNTYNSRPLPVAADKPADTESLPSEFLRYFE